MPEWVENPFAKGYKKPEAEPTIEDTTQADLDYTMDRWQKVLSALNH